MLLFTCRLDESLVIKCVLQNAKQTEETTNDSATNETSKQVAADENRSPFPNPNPSFIKTMEYSKFSTLVKAQDENSISRYINHLHL